MFYLVNSMNAEPENDDLWQLLGKAKQPAVSPFFARNVLRAVRADQATERPGGSRWPRWSWRIAVAGACAMAIFGFVKLPLHHHMETRDATGALAHQIVTNPDYEVITHLDELAANEESALWLDDSVN